MTDGIVVSPKMGQRAVPDSSKESSVTFFLQYLDGLFRKRGSGAFEAVKPGVEVDEREL
jgi:hypothetical protein